jgi:hypothetical protein
MGVVRHVTGLWLGNRAGSQASIRPASHEPRQYARSISLPSVGYDEAELLPVLETDHQIVHGLQSVYSWVLGLDLFDT